MAAGYPGRGIALDASNNIYIANTGGNTVFKLDPSGNLLNTFSSVTGASPATFSLPIGIDVDASNNIYVADTMNNRVVEMDGAGAMVTVFSSGGGNSFAEPQGVALDPSGNLFVADTNNSRTVEFNLARSVIKTFPSGDAGIFADGANNVYLAYRAGSMTMFNTGGGPITSVYTSGGVSISLALDVAVNNAGHIFVSDYLQSRVLELNPDGSTFNIHTGAAGISFNGPAGVAVDGSGNVYVTDLNNGRIFKYASP